MANLNIIAKPSFNVLKSADCFKRSVDIMEHIQQPQRWQPNTQH